MNKPIPRSVLFSLLALIALGTFSAARADSKRTKAVNKLAFAVEEIDIVKRAFDEGEQDQLKGQFKRAKGYFKDGLNGIRKADKSIETNEQTEIYEDRLATLTRDKKELDAETVAQIAELFQEAHDHFAES